MDVTVLRYHLAHTVSLSHQGRVGIIRTEVRPVFVATLRFLVLELYMVEVVLVFVEAINGDRQEPASFLVIFGIGIHHPLVAWR